SNVILIMTSNLPGDPIDFFRPEFINRLDDIVRFRPLAQSDLTHIVDIQLAHLQQRLADRRITLTVSDAAKQRLSEQGYDPQFGARPLKRLIQREIGDRLAVALLDGTVTENSTVVVDLVDDEYAITA
ncbi:MAG: type VI secretion system ATPase TssH, partial [Microthrixaceae bacterium]|nr:type VI secretion system ATPase TssH [Microthrixaceae bacterium]